MRRGWAGSLDHGGRDAAHVLVVAALVMLVPLMVGHVLGGTGTLAVTIPAAFVIVVVLIGSMHLRQRHRVAPIELLVAVWICVIQALPLWWGTLVGDPLLAADLANIGVKPLSFLVLVALFNKASITVQRLVTLTHRFSLLVLAVAIYGIVIGLADVAGIRPGVSSYAVNYSSFLANRNQFGMLLFLGLSALLLARALRGPRAFDVIVGLTLLLSVVLTMSRGSLLGVGLMIGVVAALRKPAAVALFAAPGVALGAALAFLHPSVRLYVTQFLIRPDVGLSGRDDIWRIG